MNAREILITTKLFAESLNADEIKFLAAQSRPAFFLAGTRLMNQGDFGGSMYVIVKGEVSVNLVDRDAREQSVAALGPGDIVGEMSLFTGDRRTATVSAVSNVDAVEITKWSLERVFSKSPGLVDRFAEVLAKRQAELNNLASTQGSSREAFIRQARNAFAGLFGGAR
jgi:CRP-like cAMP-binding protein